VSGYFVRRALYIIPTLIGVTLVAFLLLKLAPGDPAQILAGQDADPATIQALREQMGLDRPLPLQYFAFLTDLAKGDLGTSYATRRPVAEEVVRRYPRTFSLAVASVSIAFVLGVMLGITASLKPNSLLDSACMTLALGALSFPSYAVALVLIFVFGVQFRLVPTVGLERPESLILPTISLALYPMAYIARLTRTGLIEVLGQDYVRTARAKGVRERSVLLTHALRNALIPVVTATALSFAFALGGTVLVEQIFAINGIGKLMLDGISARDMPVVIAAMLVITLNFIAVLLALDVLNGVIDPRVRR
jgi:peptide/nickel transport system permease protein